MKEKTGIPTWVAVLVSIWFPPAGIYFVWKYSKFNNSKKFIFSVLLCVLLGVYVIAALMQESKNPNDTENYISEEQKKPKEEKELEEETIGESVNAEEKYENDKSSKKEGTHKKKTKKKTKKKKLSKSEYIKKCEEMFYDDVFFSDDSLDGEYLKLHLYFSESYFFTVDDMYNESTNKFYKDNNLYRDFFKCCVLREDTDSYVGEQINVFFTKDYKLKPSKYKTGDTVVMYGEVVDFAKNYWTGYNSVSFIPKYIEKE